ncbi:MAG: polysaccharide deacetylase family protein [Anaerolineales bacterium]|nr:polysaccharide deacetylase family protein [Anaerolineales bacterium]
MTPSPRLLLTIDYESWFALSRRHDFLASEKRFALDEGYSRDAIDPILEMLGEAKASFYLVGELVEWYPDLPQKIFNAGHEVGFHCQVHRPLTIVSDIKHDLQTSAGWRKKYKVHGFRAPMINTVESVYPLLEQNNFTYSSSLYAPTGTILQKGKIWEIPASTLPLLGRPSNFHAPRRMDLSLIFGGEFPYGSSFMSGLFAKTVFKIIEKELKAGLSPVIFLHPYEIVPPTRWPARLARDLFANPLLFPFTRNKSFFLNDLLHNFPISTVEAYVNEAAQ